MVMNFCLLSTLIFLNIMSIWIMKFAWSLLLCALYVRIGPYVMNIVLS